MKINWELILQFPGLHSSLPYGHPLHFTLTSISKWLYLFVFWAELLCLVAVWILTTSTSLYFILQPSLPSRTNNPTIQASWNTITVNAGIWRQEKVLKREPKPGLSVDGSHPQPTDHPACVAIVMQLFSHNSGTDTCSYCFQIQYRLFNNSWL